MLFKPPTHVRNSWRFVRVPRGGRENSPELSVRPLFPLVSVCDAAAQRSPSLQPSGNVTRGLKWLWSSPGHLGLTSEHASPFSRPPSRRSLPLSTSPPLPQPDLFSTLNRLRLRPRSQASSPAPPSDSYETAEDGGVW